MHGLLHIRSDLGGENIEVARVQIGLEGRVILQVPAHIIKE